MNAVVLTNKFTNREYVYFGCYGCGSNLQPVAFIEIWQKQRIMSSATDVLTTRLEKGYEDAQVFENEDRCSIVPSSDGVDGADLALISCGNFKEHICATYNLKRKPVDVY
ncbi:hypothetical protein N7533_008908 [Penicillium manginii]|uniref:uncharacterized protein n=1 Tax=Penicillium manginii TaxID=203109 RepID=UPI0025473330|nr:uncharacterized protein N7533_008908 [Penicillium manginii]KAJ5744038.1 hypothetical protein N7533_008908 [Penicillium manginii]